MVSFEIGMPCQDHNWRPVWFALWKLCECSLPSLSLTCVTAWQVGASLACLMTDCELFQPPITTSYPSQPSHGASSTRASAAARTWNSISTSTENWQSKVGKIWNMSESRISILFCDHNEQNNNHCKTSTKWHFYIRLTIAIHFHTSADNGEK